MTFADRKKQLIAEGAIYRAQVVLGRETARVSLRPDALASGVLRGVLQGALPSLATRALTAFLNRGASGYAGMLPVLLPLAMRGVSAIGKHKRLRKALLCVAALTAAAGVAASWAKRKQG